MFKRTLRGIFAKVVCVGARLGIVVALYLVALLGALQLAAVLPEPWSAVGITALVLVAGLALRGKWPGGLGGQTGRFPKFPCSFEPFSIDSYYLNYKGH